MIAERTNATVTSTITGTEYQMGLAQHALVHIMDVLTNLYGDRQMAVIREYSTNARDAHIAAGVQRPIEVSLPSDLSPFLKIKDYGVGLSEEDIAEVYSMYGASTKRDTNDQQGMLGMGSKSGLAYSSQFSVISVKDHQRTTISVSRNEQGIASMTVVERVPTTEPNGTEVIIPAGKSNEFAEKAKHLYSYWDEGTVLVNGKAPQRVEGLEVSTDKSFNVTIETNDGPRQKTVTLHKLLLVSDEQGGGSNVIVMGGVPYPCDYTNRLDIPTYSRHHIVAFVGIGDVNFAPSREKLMDTPITKATLAAISEEFKAEIGNAIQRRIDTLDDPRHAFRVAAEWTNVIGSAARDFKYTYNNKEIPTRFEAPYVTQAYLNRETNEWEDSQVQSRWVTTRRSTSPLKKTYNEVAISAAAAMNALWIYGYDQATFSAASKKKINMFCDNNGLAQDVELYVLHKDKISSEWIDASRIVPWETIKAIKLPINRNGQYAGKSRASGSFDMYVSGSKKWGVPADEIDASEPIYYVNTTYENENASLIKLITDQEPDCTVVLLTNNRLAKFLREFPMARKARDRAEEVYKTVAGKLTKQSLKAYVLMNDTYTKRGLVKLDPERIDDPELRHMIAVAKGQRLSKKVKARIERARELGKLIGKNPLAGIDSEHNLNQKYPLLDWGSYYSDDFEHPHAYLYINAAYAARQTKENN